MMRSYVSNDVKLLDAANNRMPTMVGLWRAQLSQQSASLPNDVDISKSLLSCSRGRIVRSAHNPMLQYLHETNVSIANNHRRNADHHDCFSFSLSGSPLASSSISFFFLSSFAAFLSCSSDFRFPSLYFSPFSLRYRHVLTTPEVTRPLTD